MCTFHKEKRRPIGTYLSSSNSKKKKRAIEILDGLEIKGWRTSVKMSEYERCSPAYTSKWEFLGDLEGKSYDVPLSF